MAIRQRPPRGMALLWVVALLTVMLVLVGVVARSLVTAHREHRDRFRQLQAEFLAESGFARAAAKLAQSHDYSGETWSLPADAQLDAPATIVIAVETVADRPQERRLQITAQYGASDVHRAVTHKQVTLTLPPPIAPSEAPPAS